jgi:peptidoglycan-N-acetylglucosamine deacetylase
MRLAALSVDLDEVPCYAAIHGLQGSLEPAADVAHAIYRRALPRFEALFDQLNVRATFFAVGSDLADARASEAIGRLHGAGHEIGNHSYLHRYDLTRTSAEMMRADVARGSSAIAAITGLRPCGFRAPGYVVTDALLDELQAQQMLYDSSVFPCPAYYAAKTLAIAAIRAMGRRSHSIVDDPRVLAAPADPYRVARPYHRRGEGLLELPIGVTSERTGRLPFIGTYVVLGGTGGAAWLSRQMLDRPLVNLELHGIDLADAAQDGLQFLVPHQPDLRRTMIDKRRALESAIWTLRGAGYEFVTLREAAVRLHDSV